MPRVTIGRGNFNYCLDDFTDPWVESPVIFMHHGYCRNLKFWNSWVPILARKFKVLRFDVRGCGESSIPSEGYPWSTDQLARDALAIIDRLGFQKIIWVGESSGGVMGILFASLFPERVQNLVICDTPFKFGDKILADYSAGQGDPAAGIEKLGFKEWCALTMGHRIDLARADPKLVQWYAAEMLKTPEHVAKAFIRIFTRSDVSSLLPKIICPTLLLAGGRSPIAGPDQQQVMKERLPQAHFETLEDLGHGVFLLAPERCTTAMVKFLANSC